MRKQNRKLRYYGFNWFSIEWTSWWMERCKSSDLTVNVRGFDNLASDRGLNNANITEIWHGVNDANTVIEHWLDLGQTILFVLLKPLTVTQNLVTEL